MSSSNGNIFRVTGHLCGEFTSHRWIPCTKASDAELWGFCLICAWMNGWVNNREAGDLRSHRTHYDVTIMYRLSVLLYTKSVIHYVSNEELKALYVWLNNTVGCIKHDIFGKWGKHILILLSQVMDICVCVCLSVNWVIGVEDGGSLSCEHQAHYFNSLAPRGFDYSLKLVNFKLISMMNIWSIFCEVAIRRQATSHYLNQCWPRSLSPYDVTRPQWVNHCRFVIRENA